MTERDAFMAAIKAHPHDDTPRLVFADFLDELPEPTDLDRATSEFIRVSCGKYVKSKDQERMHRDAYPWLNTNWRRLLPTLMAKDAGPVCFKWKRMGRDVHLFAPLTGNPNSYWRNAVQIEFWKGIVRRVWFYTHELREIAESLILADQPITEVRHLDILEAQDQTEGEPRAVGGGTFVVPLANPRPMTHGTNE